RFGFGDAVHAVSRARKGAEAREAANKNCPYAANSSPFTLRPVPAGPRAGTTTTAGIPWKSKGLRPFAARGDRLAWCVPQGLLEARGDPDSRPHPRCP